MKSSAILALLYLVTLATNASTLPQDQPLKQQVLTDPASATRGEKIFNGTCTFCHGHEGRGGQGRPLYGHQLEPNQIFKIITKGRRRGGIRMPPYQKAFSDVERWELVAYLLTLSSEPPSIVPTKVETQ